MAKIEQPNNLAEKTLVCLVLDKSESMEGTPIEELNNGVKSFLTEISSDSALSNRLEICIVEFNHTVQVTHEPSLADAIEFRNIQAAGTTAMVDAVREAIKIVENRKAFYRSNNIAYKLPWLVLLTDGAPDKNQDVDGLAVEIEQLTKAQKFMFLPIGVEQADMKVLNQLGGYKKVSGAFVKQEALALKGTKFVDFFEWLSASMSMVIGAQGEQIVAPSIDNWLVFPTR